MKQIRYEDGTLKSLDDIKGFSLIFGETNDIVIRWSDHNEVLASYKDKKKAKSEFARLREAYVHRPIIEAPRKESL